MTLEHALFLGEEKAKGVEDGWVGEVQVEDSKSMMLSGGICIVLSMENFLKIR